MRRLPKIGAAYGQGLGLSLGSLFPKMVKAMADLEVAAAKAAAIMTGMGRSLKQHDEVWMSGQEARYFVRAGQDPTYAERPDALVAELMRLPGLTPANRGRLAAAAIRGWVLAYGTDEPVLVAWHRLLGTTRVMVGRQA